MRDVREALRAGGGRIGDALAMSMSPYCDGTYKAFFEGVCTLDLTNSFTVFEMSDLESKKDLRQVVVMCLLFQISERMRNGGRSQRKMVIVDEAWQMLGGGAAGEFINGFVRRCRKEGGALITGTQSINDYFANEGANAAFENSQWKVVLRISAEEAEGLKESKRLALDDASLNVLKTIKIEPAGVFRDDGGWAWNPVYWAVRAQPLFGQRISRPRRPSNSGSMAAFMPAMRLAMYRRGRLCNGS